MTFTPPPNDPAEPGPGGYPTYPGQVSQPGPGGYPVHPGTPLGGGGGFPGAPGGDVPQPGSIRLAVRLMWAGAGLSLLGLLVTLLTLDSLKSQLRDSLEKSDPNYTQSEFDAFYAVSVTIGVVASLVGIALWAWMAWKNGQGRSWARIVATVFGALNLLSTLATLGFGGATGVSVAVSLVSLLLAIVILIQLWRKESSEFYAARSRPKYA